MKLTPVVLMLALALTRPTGAFASGAPIVETNVVVDMTPAGRRVPAPTPSHPAYYLPFVAGYKVYGDTIAGEKPPPPPREIAHLVAEALASQGYFVTNATHRPSLIIAVHYGAMNPSKMSAPGGGEIFFNAPQMLALMAGHTLSNLELDFEKNPVMEGIEHDRYFVALSVYDFEAYRRGRKKVMLWQAKMSVAANRVYFPDVVAPLLTAGAPYFGRDMMRPKQNLVPATPEGQVRVGVPTVKQ